MQASALRFLSAALCAVALSASAQQPAPEGRPPTVPEALMLRAAERMQRGDLRGALADVNEALARDSKSAPAYALRGTILMTAGDRKDAMADMTRAIELAPNENGVEVVHANRAHLLWLEGRALEAERDADRALALNPTYAPALHVRARLKADRGDLDGARNDLDQALAAAPRMMSGYFTRATVNMIAGRLQEALSDFKLLMWSLPRDADAVAGHGIVRGLLGETGPALDDLVRAKGMSPLSVYNGDRASSAARRLDQYREMNPNDARAILMNGVVRIMNNDVAGGFAELDRAVALDRGLAPDAALVRQRTAR
jgi:tetratricopeptide (TPR) repeat protein